MTNEDNEMLGLFIQEATEHLQTLDDDLVAMESGPHDEERINRVFRAVHSIKGTAGFFGFSSIVNMAHAMENLMSLVRDGEIPVSTPLVDALFSGTDILRLMIDDPANSGTVDPSAQIAKVNSLISGDEITEVPSVEPTPDFPPQEEPMTPDPEVLAEEIETASQPAPSPQATPQESELPEFLSRFEFNKPLVDEAIASQRNLYLLEIRLATDVEKQGQSLAAYFAELDSLGLIVASSTDFSAISGIDVSLECDPVCSVLFSTSMEDTLLLGAFDLASSQLLQLSLETLEKWALHQASIPAPAPLPKKVEKTTAAPKPRQKPPVAAPEAAIVVATQEPDHKPVALAAAEPTRIFPSKVKAEESVRIGVHLLDNLMNLASEMVLGRNKLVRIAERDATGTAVEGLRAVVGEINSVTSEMQRTIMRARLQPVGILFNKFTRIVRDLGQKLNKDIHLEIIGEDVELDRTLLEGLSDPLTHLVRNSADHGVETAKERSAVGKPPIGRVRLAAAHLNGRVQIEVRDDGRGLNPNILKAKAIEKGLITPETAARMSDAEACQIIFNPGFSTAAAVSDVSGRGVGMDVVKTNIEKLGGHVELDSQVGRGTAIIIRLPLTLAIIPALIVTCGSGSFAVPQINLEEIVVPGPDYPIEFLGSARVIRLREELLPVLDLAEIIGQPPSKKEMTNRYVLVLQLDHSRFGLLVDDISNTEEIVVKPLGRHLKSVHYYSGATLLGQGEIALILDPAALAQGRLPTEDLTSTAASSKHLLLTETSHDVERVLVFRDASPERFALHLTNITRVERIPASRVERIGNRDCLRQANGPTLQLIRPGNYLPAASPEPYADEIFVIVPRLVHHPVGIVASEILDSTDLDPDSLDHKMIESPALLGTTSLLDRLTLVIDIYGLLRAAGFADSATSATSLHSLRVLFAEDTAFFREAVLRALTGVVGSLDIVPDGEQAWELLQKKDYDLLITDIEMPKVDGFELAAHVREVAKTEHMPIIALSARNSPPYLEKAAKVGINHYETKFDRERIIAAVEKVMAAKLLH